ncbi:non-ribosomal peptide synthetase [Kitasatospora sp. Root107]|nr:non-ribosomal peptide synthetase [Kitasatospora sp. Root107]
MPRSLTGADAPACVFFTSGSTGRPKGVAVPHRAVLRSFLDGGYADLGPDTVMPLVAAPYWDAGTLETFGSLLNGGCAVEVPDGLLTPAGLRRLVREDGVNTLFLTSSLANLILDEDPGAFTGVRHLMVGGERVSPSHLATFLAEHPGVRLSNCYGPVESMVFATTHDVSAADLDAADGIPIGTAIRNTVLAVLNAEGGLAPVGQVGELLIGGDGLALGYVNRPEENAKRFGVLELPGREPLRVYRTGDLVRMTADGRLSYLARADRQFKVRGYRIEPGEVERVLGALDGVRECFLLPVRTADGTVTGTVCAYTAEPGPALTAEELSRLSAAALPSYLRPDRFVRLDALPLGPTGKADLRAVEQLVRPVEPTGTAAPVQGPDGSPALRAVREILGVPWLGPDQDLLSFGANSLQMLRIAARLSVLLDTEFSARDVYRHSTVVALERLAARRPGRTASRPGRDDGQLSSGERRFWIAEQLAPGAPGHVAMSRIEVSGPIDAERLEQALAAVAAAHPALRTTFPLDRSRPHRAVAAHPALPPLLRRSGPGKSELTSLTDELAASVHDLANGPLLAAGLLTERADRHTLLIAVHHAVYDAHSEQVLLGDLAAAWDGAALPPASGPPAAGPAADAADADRAFWQAELAGLEPLALPVATPDLRQLWTAPVTGQPIALPAGTAGLLRAAAVRHRTPALTLLLAAWWRALSGWTGQLDLAIGTVVADRAPADDRTIGYLANGLPIRVPGHPGASGPELLALVGDRLLAAFAHGTATTGRTVPALPDHARAPAGQRPGAARRRRPAPPAGPAAGPADRTLLRAVGGRRRADGCAARAARPAAAGHPRPAHRPLRIRAEPAAHQGPDMTDTFTEPAPDRTAVAGAAPGLPLSSTQERMWFEEQLRPGGSAYLMPVISRVDGPLDPAALQHAVDTVVARHSALRTVFADLDGTPVQQVLPTVEAPVAVLDLRELPDAAEAGREAALRESRRPFDLTEGPLLRVLVIRTAEQQQLLVVTVHHLVFDGTSFGLFFAELSAAYRAALTGGQPDLPPVRRQFVEVVRADREQLTPEALDGLLGWWREYLDETPRVLELPTDRPRPAVRSHPGAQQRLLLDATVSAGVRELGRTHECTLFMTALSAFGVVLSRQTGLPELLVGTPVSTRRAGDHRVLGCFLNTLPVRLDLGADPSFAELLGRVRHSALEAFAHQRVPFQQLAADRATDRDPGRNGLVQVFFNVLPPAAPLELPDCTVEQLPFPEIDSKFDLTLYVSTVDGQLALDAVYDAELYEAERVTDLLEQVGLVLAQAVADPARPLGSFALATARATALTPDPTLELPAGYPGSVLERLAAHARRQPDRPALIGPDRSWTYRELAEQTDRTAARLLARGVRPGDVVAVQATRGPAVVVALLATLRAGAAFAILDADYPAAELALRAAELKPVAWISAAPGRAVESFMTGPVIPFDATGDPLPAPVGPTAGDLAYVSFTSGTTGRPQRVLGDHGPLAHFLDWYTRAFALGPEDRFSVLSGLGHDPFLRDVLAPLWAGAGAVFPSADLRDTAALAESLRRDRITVTHLTPALGAALAAADGAGWPLLRLAGFGGDVLGHRTLRDWAALAPAADLLNLYGATETPQAVSVHLARRAGQPAPGGAGPVPLGPGIDQVQLLVLAGDRPAAIGEIGELVVRTPHLARYAEGTGGFGRSPFAAAGPDPVYRTGDLARLRPDGLIDPLGRADHQVKIRGHRVEPAEIEAALTAQPTVRQAVVLAVPERSGGHRLVGYLATGGVRPDLAELRAELAAALPEHKVPSAFVVLDELPLTANRKTDRAALRRLGREEAAVGRYVAPAGELEEQLAGIWREVLGRERIGSRDNFFAIGGHSLLLSQVLVRVRRTLGVALSLRELFQHPTVAGLAALVERTGRGTGAERPVPRSDEHAPAPLSWTQERLWLEEQLRPGDAAYNMPLVLKVRGPLDLGALQIAVDAVLRRHAVLRTGFTLAGGAPVQQPTLGARVTVREVDLRTAPDPAGAALAEAMRETKRPFDLAVGPLLRALVLRSSAEEQLLVLTVHHIVFDGWSFGVLLDDLSRAYRAALADGAAELGSGLQFADVARWQRAEPDGDAAAALLAGWTEQLAGVPTVLELPTDRPRPAVQAHRGARRRLVLEPVVSERLRELSLRNGGTLFMTLLSAFGVVLSRYTGQDHLLVGTPVANRERAEFEDLVGCFLNTVPVRLDLHGEPGFDELVRRVTDSALASFAHQEVPFGKLVAELAPERDLSRSPLVQVLFALQNVRLGAFEAPGVTSELVEVSEANSQFDLNLRMLDTGEEILGWLDYDTDLFDPATIERLIEHLTNVLAAVAADPAVPVATVELLGRAERHRVVREWNSTAVGWDLERTLTSLLEEQAERSPERTAVRIGGRQASYAELHRRANRLAWRLRELGVGPDVVVGVHLERSVELMVALLAVLKAGGAYLPLDPGYPQERLEFMLTDSGVPVLLTGPDGAADAPAADGVTVVRVGPEAGAGYPGHAPEPTAGPDHIAYVIYTSGSTGRPKGVQVPHRGIVNRLLWMQDAYRLGADDTVLQKTPISFDVSVWELFWPLLAGAGMVLAEPGGHRDPDYLAGLIQRERVTVCHFVPPMLETFLTAAAAPDCHSLRLVACSGEALPAELARRFHRALPTAALENLYGPTEASVDVTRWSSRPGWTRPTVPIGAPIANTRVYVLDRSMAPTPIGVPGELFLGGVQLARAYGGRPELTADRFVPDPFAEPGARLYRTGDLARWRPDGTVEYLGRIDHQVKVRGFRIELGEIEAALAEQPGVGQAVVIVREDEPGDRRIVAYLTPTADGGPVPDRAALRAGIGRLLPDYMVPGAFVALPALPLSPNGKVDRQALPVPDRDRSSTAGYTAPREGTEQQLAELWQQVLRLDRVGATDNFFEIGGDSMHAVRVVGLAREQGLDIPLTELFAHQTVEAVAGWLASRTEVAQEQRPVAAFGLLSPADLAKLRAK